MHHCLLCGNPDPNLGFYPAQSIKDLIRDRCADGPLVHPIAMGWSEDTMGACRLCFHQLKRKKKGCPTKKQPLPMDATLLQTIVPGFMRQQDSRTRERMCAALTTPGNSYSRSFEVLQTLLQEKDRMHRWWAHNLKTEFFAHKSTARLIRRSVAQ